MKLTVNSDLIQEWILEFRINPLAYNTRLFSARWRCQQCTARQRTRRRIISNNLMWWFPPTVTRKNCLGSTPSAGQFWLVVIKNAEFWLVDILQGWEDHVLCWRHLWILWIQFHGSCEPWICSGDFWLLDKVYTVLWLVISKILTSDWL